MTQPGRIACLNPDCRRTTAMATDDDHNTKIVCGKCRRMLPLPLRNEWKRFTANERRLRRLVERRIREGTISRETIEGIGTRRIARHDDIWRRIEACFKAPETPVGLESFLREVGL